MPEQLFTYRVRPGRAFGPGKVHKAGDTVRLTEREASGFSDILELVESEKPAQRPTETEQLAEMLGDAELAETLAGSGFGSVQAVKELIDNGTLRMIRGVGAKRAKQIEEALRDGS